jgi:hypothetical protein
LKEGITVPDVVVPIITLKSLIAHFGEPAYVKIDVEGYEIDVLRGLSWQPPLLSFEFHHAELDTAYACLDRFTEIQSSISLLTPHGDTTQVGIWRNG